MKIHFIYFPAIFKMHLLIFFIDLLKQDLLPFFYILNYNVIVEFSSKATDFSLLTYLIHSFCPPLHCKVALIFERKAHI